MIVSKAFPPHLLEADNEIRFKYFNDYMVLHPAWEAAMQDLDEMTSGFLDQRLILLLGAAGVGKSELLKAFITKRISQRTEQMIADPQLIPGVFVELESPLIGSFNFLPFYREALANLSCVLPGKTLASIDRLAGKSLVRSLHVEAAGRKPSGEEVKDRFKDALIDRRVEICGLDEAINAFKPADSMKARSRDEFITEQANKVKTLVNKSLTTLILLGAFDFYQLCIGTAQLARRSQIVHLMPYRSIEKDLKGFLIALTGLLAHLPVDHEIDPLAHSTELFLQCLGCIGNLKNILKSALNKALKRKVKLTFHLVQESYFSAPALLKMKGEQEEGIASLSHFLSLELLADDLGPKRRTQTSSTTKAGNKRRTLKPGETSPSHRKDATKNWDAL
jgi:hypothetical protein